MSQMQFAPTVSEDIRLFNCYQAADSALPFGGTKESGWGRETCRETLEEYLETKTVVVSL